MTVGPGRSGLAVTPAPGFQFTGQMVEILVKYYLKLLSLKWRQARWRQGISIYNILLNSRLQYGCVRSITKCDLNLLRPNVVGYMLDLLWLTSLSSQEAFQNKNDHEVTHITILTKTDRETLTVTTAKTLVMSQPVKQQGFRLGAGDVPVCRPTTFMSAEQPNREICSDISLC